MVVKVPLRTHLITPQDDIVQVVERYAGRIAAPGDLIVLAESVVAISQGRIFRPEEVKAGRLARLLCRYTKRHGSLTSPATMQLAMDEVGTWRILLAAAAGAVGRLLRRPGYFYRVAGLPVALIDDVAGTMPPFHAHIVLGPRHADQVAQAVADRLGVDTVIVDANDLGKVDVVGASRGVPRRLVSSLLTDNPCGNYEQQTPLTVVKAYRQAAGREGRTA
ncbi:MAG TPA: F420-0:Gamma-glutamyl ligase [Firmicutes bacterium]|nr:F420-0:Gamma-glutamyl ligase [Bacillota bacterium]